MSERAFYIGSESGYDGQKLSNTNEGSFRRPDISGRLFKIETDLADTAIAQLAAEVIQQAEVYNSRHLAFLAYLDDSQETISN